MKFSCFPTSPEAKRMAAIFHRKPTSKWTEKEVKAFKNLLPIDNEDLELVERCYRVQWPPRISVNQLRHDLITMMNNFPGEVDKARAWCSKHPIKQPPRKIIPLPVPPEQEMTETERQQAAAEFERLMGRKPVFGGYE